MREMIFKNSYFPKPKKRVISVEEIFQKNGILTKTQKKSLYFIRSRYHIDSKKDLKKWAADKKKNPRLNKKWFHIMRKHSDREGMDELICKSRGSFYAIVGKDIYNIIFVHSMKMEMSQVD